MRTRGVALFLALALALLWMAAGTGRAGVSFDAANRVLLVTDFPAEFPCTLKRLATVDRQCGWGQVAYDATADTYTVSCGLRIGANDGTDTFFQVGTASNPHEVLVMRGTLEVAPYWVAGESPEAKWWEAPRRINRLTLGAPQIPGIAPTLEFDCQTRGQYGLRLGATNGTGGQLYAYGAAITAATPDKAHAFGLPPRGDLSLLGDGLILERTTISWVAGMMLYGVSSDMRREYRIEDCVFENACSGLSNGRNDLTRCAFRNMDMAVYDYGSLDAVLTDCVFENNTCNLSLTFTSHGVVAVDCELQPPGKGDAYRCYQNPATKKTQYPSFTSRRHVIVAVVDEQGKPVAAAQVTVRNEQGALENVEFGKSVTDTAGLTPGRGAAKAILLTELVRRATATENQPETAAFTYAVEVAAAGFAPATRTGWRPTQSWETLRVALQK